MNCIKWNIGCSGFHYREWRGIFYPDTLPQKDWFKFYSERFNTLELNVTFYQFPKIDSLKRWHNISPDGFVFAVKAPRLITHYKRFSGCSILISDFYNNVMNGLKEKLGPVLFQLPPKFIYSDDRLDMIVKSLSGEFENVVEFRDASWWIPAVKKRLKEHGIIFCGIDHPGLLNLPVVTNRIVYYRFHGNPRLYFSAYKRKELTIVADKILSTKKVTEAYVFFNNTATAAAIRNADQFRKIVKC